MLRRSRLQGSEAVVTRVVWPGACFGFGGQLVSFAKSTAAENPRKVVSGPEPVQRGCERGRGSRVRGANEGPSETDGRTDGRTDGQTDRQTETDKQRQTNRDRQTETDIERVLTDAGVWVGGCWSRRCSCGGRARSRSSCRVRTGWTRRSASRVSASSARSTAPAPHTDPQAKPLPLPIPRSGMTTTMAWSRSSETLPTEAEA
eukprot:386459-Rhodomonas_salina.2